MLIGAAGGQQPQFRSHRPQACLLLGAKGRVECLHAIEAAILEPDQQLPQSLDIAFQKQQG